MRGLPSRNTHPLNPHVKCASRALSVLVVTCILAVRCTLSHCHARMQRHPWRDGTSGVIGFPKEEERERMGQQR